MEPPRRSWLPVPSNCPVSPPSPSYTRRAALSALTAPSPSKYPAPLPPSLPLRLVGRMRLPLQLQGGCLLLITDAKVIRSPWCASISGPD